jgi:hypothetical protein
MNGQDIGERFDTLDIVDRTDMDTNTPPENSDPFADKVPVDADLIHETPLGGTDVAVGSVDEMVVHEDLMSEAIPDKATVGEPIADESRAGLSIPYKTPIGETITHEAPLGTNAGSTVALLNREESEHFRARWHEIQGKFVDEPRSAVLEADALVSEVIERITQMFTNEHSSLEAQWNQGDDVSTEDLRKALQHYRSFFNRLVV